MTDLPNATITFMIEKDGKFLMICRGSKEDNFPGLWAFPGGKVELEETAIDTIRREIAEETGLELDGHGAFLNTYWFKRTVGFTFLVRAKTSDVTLTEEFSEYEWVSSLNDLKGKRCIPGIYNHLVDAHERLGKGPLDKLDRYNLIRENYLNNG